MREQNQRQNQRNVRIESYHGDWDCYQFGIGMIIDNVIGRITLRMLGALICHPCIRKNIKEINPKDKKEQAHLLRYSFVNHNEGK